MTLCDIVIPKLEQLSNRSCFRFFHGRGGLYPPFIDLAIEWYAPVILIILYRDDYTQDLEQLVSELKKVAATKGIEGIVLQKRFLAQSPKQLIWGSVPEPHLVVEDGLEIQVNLLNNQNHGLFLDSYNVRRKVEEISANKVVLNLFAYSCCISLYAKKGLARKVINVDMSNSALRLGRTNHLNNSLIQGVEFFAHDILKSFGKLDRHSPYDLIIVDPPSTQWQSFNYRKDYTKLLKRLVPMLSENGEMLLCLNDPEESQAFLQQLIAPYSLHIVESLGLTQGFEEKNIEQGLKVIRVANCLDHR